MLTVSRCATLLLFIGLLQRAVAQPVSQPITVDVKSTLRELLNDEDTDGDKRITIDDNRIDGTSRGDKSFWMKTVDGRSVEIAGTPYLSNLLQELKLAEDAEDSIAILDPGHVFEPPADRISRLIKGLFWDELTRTIDERGLQRTLTDSKTHQAGSASYLYVPPSDQTAVKYYSHVAANHPQWHLNVVVLPRKITPQFVKSLEGKHGLLSLALEKSKDGEIHGKPFVVPGGRFNEMYGWDSYFIVLGLLHDGKTELARSMVENAVYEIRHYGAILNANRTYYLTRSQPPFLTSMIKAVYSHLDRSAATKEWLRQALDAAVTEYRTVWMGPQRLTATGLSRYFDSGSGPCPEVHEYGEVFRRFAVKHGMPVAEFERGYRAGQISDPELDAYFVHDRAMRESGHDTSYRLINRCANLVTVDLNALLYKIETDLEELIRDEFGGSLRLNDGSVSRAADWETRAEARKKRINRYLWNEKAGMYFDYDYVHQQQTGYESATTLYPLWAGAASKEQARLLIEKALPKFEAPGGIVASTEESRGPITPDHPLRQWDYPYGWSPHQILVWRGLQRYGDERDARRLAYRWLFTITVNAALYNGTVPEKFDVVKRTHAVFAEYGNVGTTFSYITKEGFGWTNTSYQLGLDLLTPSLRAELNRLVPPEWIRVF